MVFIQGQMELCVAEPGGKVLRLRVNRADTVASLARRITTLAGYVGPSAHELAIFAPGGRRLFGLRRLSEDCEHGGFAQGEELLGDLSSDRGAGMAAELERLAVCDPGLIKQPPKRSDPAGPWDLLIEGRGLQLPERVKLDDGLGPDPRRHVESPPVVDGIGDMARYGQLEALRRALDSHPERKRLEQKSEQGETPLISAAASGDSKAVMVLLAAKADLQARDKENHTAVYWAARNGHSQVWAMLNEATQAGQRERSGKWQGWIEEQFPQARPKVVSKGYDGHPDTPDKDNNRYYYAHGKYVKY